MGDSYTKKMVSSRCEMLVRHIAMCLNRCKDVF